MSECQNGSRYHIGAICSIIKYNFCISVNIPCGFHRLDRTHWCVCWMSKLCENHETYLCGRLCRPSTTVTTSVFGGKCFPQPFFHSMFACLHTQSKHHSASWHKLGSNRRFFLIFRFNFLPIFVFVVDIRMKMNLWSLCELGMIYKWRIYCAAHSARYAYFLPCVDDRTRNWNCVYTLHRASWKYDVVYICKRVKLNCHSLALLPTQAKHACIRRQSPEIRSWRQLHLIWLRAFRSDQFRSTTIA